jgi:hypothetical protein
MKQLVLTIIAVFIMAGFASTLLAQTSATVPATPAGAVLIKAMTLTQIAPLHFGSIVLTTTAGGTCELASTGATRTFTGGCANSPATPIPTNAAYNVTGTINETYSLTLPATTTVTHTTLSSGVYQMDITLMSARFNGASSDATTSTLTSSGTDSFTVGGTLTIKANQLGGIYAGTFPVSVDYN